MLGTKYVPINLQRLNTHREYSLNVTIKLEISNSKIFRRCPKLWKLISTLWNNSSVKEYITMEIRKYTTLNSNENIACQSLWDATKAILRGKFIPLHAYFINK